MILTGCLLLADTYESVHNDRHDTTGGALFALMICMAFDLSMAATLAGGF